MSKTIEKEQKVARTHPVVLPLIFILGGTVLIAFVLVYLLIQSKNENSKLHQQLEQNKPIQNFEQNQSQDYMNTEDGL